MKAAIFHAHGPVDNLQIAEMPQPEPGPGEVLLRVRAVALNHLDLFVREGIPSIRLTLPHIGGSDIAGEVAELGADVDGWSVGDHVVVNPGLCGHCEWCRIGEESLCVNYRLIGEYVGGGLAEYFVAPAMNLVRIPPDYPFAQAAAAPLVFMTAWRALMSQGHLRAGQSVLIMGAGGGVATAAIQIARLAGATVYAASRSEVKQQAARDLGADDVLDSAGDFAREIWTRTGKRGVDLVLESIGAATWERSLRCVTKGGRLVVYGATSGPQVQIDLRPLFWKQYAIIGSTMANCAETAAVLGLVFDERRLRPIVDRVLPLDEIRSGHRLLESGEQFGKILLIP